LRYLITAFIFSSSLLYAISSDKIEYKIILSMLNSITSHTSLSIYTDSKRIEQLLSKNNDITFLENCDKVDISILEKNKMINKCVNGPIITLEYDLLKVYPNSVGSFFWQKGRPNIVFIESRLKDQNITIDSGFNDYIEETIW